MLFDFFFSSSFPLRNPNVADKNRKRSFKRITQKVPDLDLHFSSEKERFISHLLKSNVASFNFPRIFDMHLITQPFAIPKAKIVMMHEPSSKVCFPITRGGI